MATPDSPDAVPDRQGRDSTFSLAFHRLGKRYCERGLDLRPLLVDLLCTSPSHISTSYESNRTFANLAKGFIEEWSGEEWDWSPLRPYHRSLVEGEALLHWFCVSAIA